MNGSTTSKPKVALIYDRVNTSYGGAENVVLEISKLFPSAPIFTSVYDKKQAIWAKNLDVRPSFLQPIQLGANHRLLAPLIPMALETLDLSEFDIVISISSAEAKGVLTQPHQLHICYLLTPSRFLHSHNQQYLKKEQIFSFPGFKYLLTPVLNHLKKWDFISGQRPDLIVSISKLVATRCQKYYQRSSESIIYPPVSIANKNNFDSTKKSDFLLIISRLVHYKQIDLAIKACHQIKKQLIIIGEGPEKSRLQKLINSLNTTSIKMLGSVSEIKKASYLSSCQALLMPGVEDFGLVGLEANSYAKPVITNSKSGVAEVIENGKHGIYITKNTVSELIEAISHLEKTEFDPQVLTSNALKYDTTRFLERFKAFINQEWTKHKNRIGE